MTRFVNCYADWFRKATRTVARDKLRAQIEAAIANGYRNVFLNIRYDDPHVGVARLVCREFADRVRIFIYLRPYGKPSGWPVAQLYSDAGFKKYVEPWCIVGAAMIYVDASFNKSETVETFLRWKRLYPKVIFGAEAFGTALNDYPNPRVEMARAAVNRGHDKMRAPEQCAIICTGHHTNAGKTAWETRGMTFGQWAKMVRDNGYSLIINSDWMRKQLDEEIARAKEAAR